MCVHKEEDSDTKQVYFYLFRLLRKSILTMSKPVVVGPLVSTTRWSSSLIFFLDPSSMFSLEICAQTGVPSVRKAEHRQGSDQLCAVQIRPSAPERLADNVRPGQDVPALPQPLETGDPGLQEAAHVDGRRLGVQGQLHPVALLLSRAGLLRLAAPLRHHHRVRPDPAQVRVPGERQRLSGCARPESSSSSVRIKERSFVFCRR